jgi:geranylgeranyl diphosphate synthase, type II
MSAFLTAPSPRVRPSPHHVPLHPLRRPRRAAPTAVAARQEARTDAAPPAPPASSKALLVALAAEKAVVDAALDDCLPAESGNAKRILDAMRYSLLAGGKRLRPILTLAAYDMFASTEGDADTIARRRTGAAMPAALAVEMIHTMSLIHDDLPAMDNDDFRRGRPTCHKVYGEDVAILAGDALLAYAYEYVASHTVGVDPTRVVQVIGLLAESVGANGLAGGQVMDLDSEGRNDVSLDDLTWIHTHKTATLLRVSVAAGAILGGASDDDVARVSQFAVKTGLAFQIADDVLDMTATTEVLGKTAGKDEAVNKATYPRLMGLEASRAHAARLIREAKECIAPYGDRAVPLLGLADFIINRAN